MIRYIKSDIVDEIKTGKYDAAAHGCNCFCRMRSGVAKALTDAWPDIAVADKRLTQEGDFNKLGSYSNLDIKQIIDGQTKQLIRFYNLYTQYNYGYDGGQYLKYDALSLALEKMARSLNSYNQDIIMPKIGCGLAGGDWNIVEEIIENKLEKFNVTICEL